ncbi:MAG: hypothetical protein CEO22_423 [Candidatus Berkelbacteria bacterium Gr01-1014_85]|uniref:Uncharacterized protein n=1 Tax=Candidatus Berkelbacteria bacterium Gr01-1014_85 TaxID=2017150 RepID=A0A554JB71_9BACT|nr:MAG: hypothetical protein CEO22_423 [Candidatus Berkelbacteria bacterium Gr01-1014_85]
MISHRASVWWCLGLSLGLGLWLLLPLEAQAQFSGNRRTQTSNLPTNNPGVALNQDYTRTSQRIETLRAQATSAIDQAISREIDDTRLASRLRQIVTQLNLAITDNVNAFKASNDTNFRSNSGQTGLALEQSLAARSATAQLEHQADAAISEVNALLRNTASLEARRLENLPNQAANYTNFRSTPLSSSVLQRSIPTDATLPDFSRRYNSLSGGRAYVPNYTTYLPQRLQSGNTISLDRIVSYEALKTGQRLTQQSFNQIFTNIGQTLGGTLGADLLGIRAQLSFYSITDQTFNVTIQSLSGGDSPSTGNAGSTISVAPRTANTQKLKSGSYLVSFSPSSPSMTTQNPSRQGVNCGQSFSRAGAMSNQLNGNFRLDLQGGDRWEIALPCPPRRVQ